MKKFIIIILAIVGFALPSYPQFASDRFSDMRESNGWLDKGYRGFVELGGGGAEGGGSFFINTTHGYQFSEWFFAGAGIGYLYTETEYYHNNHYDSYTCDLFEYYADFRLTIPTHSRFYPFADFKLGGVAGGVAGDGIDIYINAELGARFALNHTLGLSLGVYCNYVGYDCADSPILGVALGFDF